jgi:hypothetical protein
LGVFCIVEIETAIVFCPLELDAGLLVREMLTIIKGFSWLLLQKKSCAAGG